MAGAGSGHRWHRVSQRPEPPERPAELQGPGHGAGLQLRTAHSGQVETRSSSARQGLGCRSPHADQDGPTPGTQESSLRTVHVAPCDWWLWLVTWPLPPGAFASLALRLPLWVSPLLQINAPAYCLHPAWGALSGPVRHSLCSIARYPWQALPHPVQMHPEGRAPSQNLLHPGLGPPGGHYGLHSPVAPLTGPAGDPPELSQNMRSQML